MHRKYFAVVARRFPLELPPPPGEDCFLAPASMMAQAGFEVEVLTLRDNHQSHQETLNGMTIRRFDSQRQLLAAIAATRGIVHAHSHFRPALLTGVFARRSGTVFTSHSAELPTGAWKRRMLVVLMNRFDRIIALTGYERDVYESVGVPPSKIVVVGDTINVEFFSQPGNADRFRRRWSVPADSPVVLFVANLRRFKNTDVVLRAFRRVREQVPTAALVVVGKDHLPRQGLAPVTELARQVGVNDGLVLTDWLPPEELRDAYTVAAVAINSSGSLQESFSISTWEAIAAGRPVCLPRLGTLVTTVGDGTLYHEPLDDAGLAANILRYLREPELAAAHCQRNRALVNAYAAPTGLAKLREVYLSLLER